MCRDRPPGWASAGVKVLCIRGSAWRITMSSFLFSCACGGIAVFRSPFSLLNIPDFKNASTANFAKVDKLRMRMCYYCPAFRRPLAESLKRHCSHCFRYYFSQPGAGSTSFAGHFHHPE